MWHMLVARTHLHVEHPIEHSVVIHIYLAVCSLACIFRHPAEFANYSLKLEHYNMFPSILTFGLLPLAVLAAPQGPGNEPPSPGPGVPQNVFDLFAYGEGFGGLAVFNWNGAYD